MVVCVGRGRLVNRGPRGLRVHIVMRTVCRMRKGVERKVYRYPRTRGGGQEREKGRVGAGGGGGSGLARLSEKGRGPVRAEKKGVRHK